MSANNDLTKEQMDQLAGVFRAEAIEHVRTLAEILFSLEEGNETDVQGALARAFREAHSLKGSAGTLGFERVAIITHRFEDALGALSNGSVDFSYQIADTLLQTLEVIRKSITECLPGDDQLTEDETEAIRNLKKLLAGSSGKEGAASAPPAPRPRSNEPPHPTKGASAPPSSATERRVEATQESSTGRQEFIRISEDRLDTVIARFGELLESTIQLESVGHDMEANSAEADRLVSSMSELLPKLDGTEQEAEAMEILDLARNLMLMLGSAATKYSQEERQVSKLIQRTQEDLRQIRMAPISTVFIALRSQARESSRSMGKRVDVEMEGGEYAVDRTVLDAIEDPLIHIVRNAVDHGIEGPDQRKTASKPETKRCKSNIVRIFAC